MKIALTGGIACGKSLLSEFLNEFGVETLDADDIVHELIPDPAERRRIAAEVFADPAKRRELEARIHPVVKERIDQWFNGTAGTSGTAETAETTETTGTTRTAETAGTTETTGTAGTNGTGACLVSPGGSGRGASPTRPQRSARSAAPTGLVKIAIIPLLFETHWEENFDIICCVASTRENQIKRMVATRGMALAEAEARLAAQLPVEEKARRSQYVIRNDGTADELRAEAQKLVDTLRASASLR